MNPQKQKGDRWELAVAKAMRLLGFPHAERTRAGWDDDKGDINAAPGLVIQAKDAKDKRWVPWLRELAAQKRHAGAAHAVLVVKQAGQPDPREALAVMRFEDWTALVRAAGYGQPLVEVEPHKEGAA
jgi:hypothetical protein